MILNAVEGKPLPVYGDGQLVRDWLYVEDHARALLTVLAEGKVGDTYNIGHHNEVRNLDVVHAIRWNDPDLGIAWPDVGGVRLGDKDAKAGSFSAAPKF